MSQDFRPDRNASQASARTLTHGIERTQHRLKLIGGRWHRWEPVSEDWLELPAHIAGEPESVAVMYAVGFFQCARRYITIERQP